jgi:hypothetical protein
VGGPHNVQTLFKNSKSLSIEKFEKQVVANAFGMSRDDLPLFQERKPKDGDSAQFVGKKGRKIPLVEYNTNHIASTQAVNLLTSKFIEVFEDLIETEPRGNTQTVLLYEYLKEKMFFSSTVARMGPKIFELNLGFNETYWKFDAAFLPLLYGLPRFLNRKNHEARDALVSAALKWEDSAWEDYDWSNGDEPDWEEHFGSRAVRTRQQMWKTAGVSMDAGAKLEIGLIFAYVLK